MIFDKYIDILGDKAIEMKNGGDCSVEVITDINHVSFEMDFIPNDIYDDKVLFTIYCGFWRVDVWVDTNVDDETFKNLFIRNSSSWFNILNNVYNDMNDESKFLKFLHIDK